MKDSAFLLLPVFFPILAGVLLLLLPKEPARRRILTGYTLTVLVLTACAACAVIAGGPVQLTLFRLTDQLTIVFRPDLTGRFFAGVVTVVWLCAGVFSLSYLRHETANKRFFGFYLIVYGILLALDFAGNLPTFYLFYELMTLSSVPLVLHDRSHAAIMAGLKYLFYSLSGAYMVLFGFYFLYHYSDSLDFTAGGVLDPALIDGHTGLLLTAAFLMLLGFGVKAGLFPLHGWLPTAHPVAPAPASAALSGVIVKAGVLGMIRVLYFLFGADFVRGTWVQTTVLILSLVTVFLGSMLAYLEKGLKKRLAYSTVSQVSYIVFGLLLLVPEAAEGALLHVAFHACIKCCLFLCAGAIIFQTGKTRVDELRGIGKEMPVTLWCFTLCALGLVGIPPLSGFVSKWYLCMGALDSGLAPFSWLGPVVLLISALLTAGYLLPISIQGFLPGRDYDYAGLRSREAGPVMLIPMLVLTGLTILLGLFPGLLTGALQPLIDTIHGMCGAIAQLVL